MAASRHDATPASELVVHHVHGLNLNYLELERGNSTRTRNVRLNAIRSLFSYAALRHPEHALLIQRVLAIPPKRFDRRIITYLTLNRPGSGGRSGIVAVSA